MLPCKLTCQKPPIHKKQKLVYSICQSEYVASSVTLLLYDMSVKKTTVTAFRQIRRGRSISGLILSY